MSYNNLSRGEISKERLERDQSNWERRRRTLTSTTRWRGRMRRYGVRDWRGSLLDVCKIDRKEVSRLAMYRTKRGGMEREKGRRKGRGWGRARDVLGVGSLAVVRDVHALAVAGDAKTIRSAVRSSHLSGGIAVTGGIHGNRTNRGRAHIPSMQ